MKKGLILYKSKYGATKKYVAMLEEELKEKFECDIYEIGDFKETTLKSYEWIVYAGGIYASGIAGLNVLRKKCKQLKNKKTAIFCVGASPYNEKAFYELKVHNLKEDLKDIPIFYGRGAWDESKMTWKDRTLCKMLQKVIAKKDPASCEPWMQALLGSVGQTCDWTDQKYLLPVLEYILKN